MGEQHSYKGWFKVKPQRNDMSVVTRGGGGFEGGSY